VTVQAFEVIVSQNGEQSESNAVANASKYLAYGDQTDTFGLWGDVFDVNVYGGEDGEDYGIGLCFAAPIVNDSELKSFMDEMVVLAKVESVERVDYEPLAYPATL